MVINSAAAKGIFCQGKEEFELPLKTLHGYSGSVLIDPSGIPEPYGIWPYGMLSTDSRQPKVRQIPHALFYYPGLFS